MLYAHMTTEKPTIANAPRVSGMGRPLTGADIIEALELEIHRQYKTAGGLKGFTTALGVDYHTYRKYIVGERKMSADLLMDSLAALDVSPDVFFRQARLRIDSEPAPGVQLED